MHTDSFLSQRPSLNRGLKEHIVHKPHSFSHHNYPAYTAISPFIEIIQIPKHAPYTVSTTPNTQQHLKTHPFSYNLLISSPQCSHSLPLQHPCRKPQNHRQNPINLPRANNISSSTGRASRSRSLRTCTSGTGFGAGSGATTTAILSAR